MPKINSVTPINDISVFSKTSTTQIKVNSELVLKTQSTSDSVLIEKTENIAFKKTNSTSLPNNEMITKRPDQSDYIREHKIYNYDNNTWNENNFKPLAKPDPVRFIGVNQVGGPQLPKEAFENPNAYNISMQKKVGISIDKDTALNLSARKLIEKFVFSGGRSDEVPKMPVKMVRDLESYLQPGDVVFQGNDVDGDKVSRNTMMHELIYLGKGSDGKGYVIHSIGVDKNTPEGKVKNGVLISTWENAIQRDVDGADRLKVLRPTHLTQESFNKVVEFAGKQIGKPYDFAFNKDDDKRFYCTELVYEAYKRAGSTISSTTEHRLFRDVLLTTGFNEAINKGELKEILTLNPKEKSDLGK